MGLGEALEGLGRVLGVVWGFLWGSVEGLGGVLEGPGAVLEGLGAVLGGLGTVFGRPRRSWDGLGRPWCAGKGSGKQSGEVW